VERRSHHGNLMKYLAPILLIISCARDPQQEVAHREQPSVTKAEMQTIDSADPRPAPIQPPPMLPDEAPSPKPLNLSPNQEVPVLSPQDERVRAQLPFAPAIALDPVEGQKVSIRASTPSVEFKNHIFYFSNEANKRTFVASPEQYLKGPFAHL
jgi:YHS domain-containing protein